MFSIDNKEKINSSAEKIVVLYMIDVLHEMGGAERNLCDIVAHLNPNRFSSIIICLSGGPLVGILKDKGVEVFDLSLRRIYSFKAIATAFKLIKFIKMRNVKIIVTYHEGSNFYGSILARLAGIPVVISNRRDMGHKLRKHEILIYKIINHLFDKIITVSDAVRDMVQKREGVNPGKLITIYNGLDLSKVNTRSDSSSVRKDLALKEHWYIVGMLARVYPIKGYEYFIDAASSVVKRFPNTYFLIVGTYAHTVDYYSQLYRKMTTNGLSQNVFFTGARQDTFQIISIFDVAVLCSLSEGFPNVVLEYMAAKKPLVATSVGGTPEAVGNDEVAILVPPQDSSALAISIIRLLENKDLARQMGARGYNRCETLFNISIMVSKIESLYECLLKQKNVKLA